MPAANSSRPNLVTKAALVEQAFALQIYDVDTVAKYDRLIEPSTGRDGFHQDCESSAATEKSYPDKLDTLTKERIFHYQAKIAAAKRYALANQMDPPAEGGNRAAAAAASDRNKQNVTPPASLVAALRQIYEEAVVVSPTDGAAAAKLKVETSTVQFELRRLLETVSTHPIFPNNSSSKADETALSTLLSHTTTSLSAKHEQANLENLILNVLKQVTDAQQSSSSGEPTLKDTEVILQGLLIAILSVLTGQKQHREPVVVGNSKERTKSAKAAAVQNKKISHLQQPENVDDIPSQSVLQVGALLSLLPLKCIVSHESADASEEKSEEGHDNAAISPGFRAEASATLIDPTLLEYFGAAATVYEERLEIQKARMLARVQTPPVVEPMEGSHSDSSLCHDGTL